MSQPGGRGRGKKEKLDLRSSQESRSPGALRSSGRGKAESASAGGAPGLSLSTSLSPTPSQQDVAASNGSSDTKPSERLHWITMNLVGHSVEVLVKSGEIITGVLHTINTDKAGLSVVLRMAKRREPGKDKDLSMVRPTETLVVAAADFLQLSAKNVANFEQAEKRNEFATDTEISGPWGMRERELVQWKPDASLDTAVDLTLSGSSEGWDQFATNRRLYGVGTTYQEELYTTPIDKNAPDYKARAREAARIAAEIEAQATGTSNAHLAEERGQETDVDEEDRYGAVIRTAPQPQPPPLGRPPGTAAPAPGSVSASGKYVPPNKRAAAAPGGQPTSPTPPAVVAQPPPQSPTPVVTPAGPAATSPAAPADGRPAVPRLTTSPVRPASASSEPIAVPLKAVSPSLSVVKSAPSVQPVLSPGGLKTTPVLLNRSTPNGNPAAAAAASSSSDDSRSRAVSTPVAPSPATQATAAIGPPSPSPSVAVAAASPGGVSAVASTSLPASGQASSPERAAESGDASQQKPPSAPSSASPSLVLSPTKTTLGDNRTLLAERLRVRQALVHETYKSNPTNVRSSGEEQRGASPLQSPLINDPKTVAGLGLEVHAPTVSEDVARDFFDFQLNRKGVTKQSQREKLIAEMKNFSSKIGKVIPMVGETKTPPRPKAAAAKEPEKAEGKSADVKKPSSPAQPLQKPTAPAAAESDKDKSAKAGKPLLERENSFSKLNPDAKPFKPVANMSAAAPAFSPTMSPAMPTPPPPPHPMQQPMPLQPGPEQQQHFKAHQEAGPMGPFYAPAPGGARGPYARPEEEMGFFQYRGPQGFVQVPFGAVAVPPGLVRAGPGFAYQQVPLVPGGPGGPPYVQPVFYPAPMFVPAPGPGMPPGAVPVATGQLQGQMKARGMPPNVKMQAPQGPPGQFPPGFVMQQPPPGVAPQFYGAPMPGAPYQMQPNMHAHPHMMPQGQPAMLVAQAQKIAYGDDAMEAPPPPPPGHSPMKFQGVPNTDSIPSDGKGQR